MSEQGPTLTAAASPRVAPAEHEASQALRIDAASAQLCGWLALAALNQLIGAFRLPSTTPLTSLIHHLYDFGQLLALGVVSWLAVRLAGAAARRWRLTGRWLGVGSFALVVFALGVAVVPDDILNLAERRNYQPWKMTVAVSLVFALVLSVPVYLRPRIRGFLRILTGAMGLVLASLNAEILRADYFAFHLMLAWFGALWLADAIEGLSVPGLLRPTAAAWRVALPSLAAASVLIPTSDSVRLRLYQLPSSVLQPLIAVLLPEPRGASRDRVPAAYLNSAWFADRSKHSATPPTRALVPSGPPIVMFFTIDAVRADVLENPHYRQQLPALGALRDSGVYFSQARSPTASTMTTLSSALAGKYYSQMRWGGEGLGAALNSDRGSRLSELLGAAGIETLFISGLPQRICDDSRASQGFRHEISLPKTQEGAGLAVNAIIAQLERSSTTPLFVFAHFFEPHAPYNLAGKQGTLFERYVREIGLVDRQLGRLRAYLQQRPDLARRSYLIISADHGEAFGEHGVVNHARTMYEELLRVPLLIDAPGSTARHVPDAVSLMDVGPTVLDLFDLPTPAFWMGESLLPLIAGGKSQFTRPIAFDGARRIQGMCFPDGHKVILDLSKKTAEVYDLGHDPGELNNLVDDGRAETAEVLETTRLFFDVVTLRAPGYTIPKRKF